MRILIRPTEETFPVRSAARNPPARKACDTDISPRSIYGGHGATACVFTCHCLRRPDPFTGETKWSRKRDFIGDLSKWKNSLNPHLVERARQDILDANGGVIDPFGQFRLRRLSSFRNARVPALERFLWMAIKNPLLEDVKKWGNWVDGGAFLSGRGDGQSRSGGFGRERFRVRVRPVVRKFR